MNLNITIDMDSLYSYCEESVAEVIKEAVAQEFGMAVRKAVRDGLSPELTAQVAKAAGAAHRRAVEKAVAELNR